MDGERVASECINVARHGSALISLLSSARPLVWAARQRVCLSGRGVGATANVMHGRRKLGSGRAANERRAPLARAPATATTSAPRKEALERRAASGSPCARAELMMKMDSSSPPRQLVCCPSAPPWLVPSICAISRRQILYLFIRSQRDSESARAKLKAHTLARRRIQNVKVLLIIRHFCSCCRLARSG